MIKKFELLGYLLKSGLYSAVGNIKKAKVVLIPAIKLNPDNNQLLSRLHTLFSYCQDMEGFVDILRELESLRPNSFYLKWNIGMSLVLLSKFQEALPYLIYCTENPPEGFGDGGIANSHARLGQCYIMLGDNSEAEKELFLSQKMVPGDIDMCFGFVQLFRVTGQQERILPFLDQKISEFPDAYPLYYWKAEYISAYLYNPSDAVIWYQKAIQLIRNGEYYKNYSQSYLATIGNAFLMNILQDYLGILIKINRDDDAFIEAIRMKLCFWSIVDFLSLQTQRLIKLKKFHMAERLCRARLLFKLKPGKASLIYSYLAMSRLELDKLEDSIYLANKAISLDKYNYYGWEALSQSLIHQGNWEKAVGILERMIEMEPYCTDWLEDLGMCYAQIGDIKKAKSYVLKVLSLDPQDSTAWVSLGDIHQKLKEDDEAIRSYQKALSTGNLVVEKENKIRNLVNSYHVKSDNC